MGEVVIKVILNYWVKISTNSRCFVSYEFCVSEKKISFHLVNFNLVLDGIQI